MKIKHILTLTAAVALAVPIVANAGCEDFTETIGNHLKRAAVDMIRSQLNPSNTGSAQRYQQGVTNHMLIVQVNVGLMQQNKCPMPKTPLDPYDYVAQASGCAMESLAAGGRLDVPGCQFDEWREIPGRGVSKGAAGVREP